MPQNRAILEHLTRDELGTIVEHYELQVADRRVREQLIDAVAGSRRAALADILPGYSRDRLKELCRALISMVQKAFSIFNKVDNTILYFLTLIAKKVNAIILQLQ